MFHLQRFVWTVLPAVLLLISAVVVHGFSSPKQQQRDSVSFGRSPFLTSSTALLDKPNIEVISQPDEDFLEKEGVFKWGTWGCLPGKFPLSYGENESCYLLSGKVTVTPVDGRPAATFGKGDFVTFPAGLSCEWDVTEAVQKHYKFF
ncbi:DUF861-containing protein [Fragilaria crotonensis]|nr:DUF861-containing protein [Fragilaria crotonensis]